MMYVRSQAVPVISFIAPITKHDLGKVSIDYEGIRFGDKRMSELHDSTSDRSTDIYVMNGRVLLVLPTSSSIPRAGFGTHNIARTLSIVPLSFLCSRYDTPKIPSKEKHTLVLRIPPPPGRFRSYPA
jgi:hypothetical protein